jgi:hypothetical protein
VFTHRKEIVMNSYKRHPAGIARKTGAVLALDNSKDMSNKYKLLAIWLVLAAIIATAVRVLPI